MNAATTVRLQSHLATAAAKAAAASLIASQGAERIAAELPKQMRAPSTAFMQRGTDFSVGRGLLVSAITSLRDALESIEALEAFAQSVEESRVA